MNAPGLCRAFLCLLLPAILAVSVVAGPASAGMGEVPANASAKRFGSGWECDRGFRESKGACVEISVPANAFATKTSYGRGWECRHGFREIREACEAIPVPDNAYLDASGLRWNCKRGFREVDEACVAIQVPRNGYLTESTYGVGWTCERGYRATKTACQFIDLPPYAHLDYSGNDWECDKPFERKQDRCVLP